jgi:lysophospholipase L1-like esterase
MKRSISIGIIAAGAIALAIGLPRFLISSPGPEPVIRPRPGSSTSRPIDPADIPAPRRMPDGSIDPAFWANHLAHLDQASANADAEVLFLGDSITYQFSTVGADTWSARIVPLQALNLAVSGYQTQHVLWQISNGELDRLHPRVIVLLIGTNNLNDSVPNIVRGITRVVTQLHQKLPKSRLLLLGLLPRDIIPGSEYREKILAINHHLVRLDDGSMTRFMDMGDAFLAPDGKMRLDTTTDGLHLSASGYAVWFSQMNPMLSELLSQASTMLSH